MRPMCHARRSWARKVLGYEGNGSAGLGKLRELGEVVERAGEGKGPMWGGE